MSLFKRKSKDTGNDVYAFISGNTIPITEVNDPVFSAKTLGDGLAIIPSGELICAPCAGEKIRPGKRTAGERKTAD